MSYNADLTFAKDMPKFDCSILSWQIFLILSILILNLYCCKPWFLFSKNIKAFNIIKNSELIFLEIDEVNENCSLFKGVLQYF